MGNQHSDNSDRFESKMNIKRLLKEARICESNYRDEVLACTKAFEKDQYELARIHAQNAVRSKNQAEKLYRLAGHMRTIQSIKVCNAIEI